MYRMFYVCVLSLIRGCLQIMGIDLPFDWLKIFDILLELKTNKSI